MRSSWWEFRDPNKFFELETLNVLSAKAFYDAMGSQLQDEDILLFVHGFNNTFEFASLRVAQLVHDIRFPGEAIVFSWPSEGKTGKNAYRRDEKRAEVSYLALAEVLSSLIQRQRETTSGKGKIHLIAHSMGNRVLLHAMHQLRGQIHDGEKPFGHVILAAADMDVDKFVAFIPSVVQPSESVTMYFCTNDLALMASRVVHINKRVGEGPVFMKELDNIDAETANTSFLGHDSYASDSAVLEDIGILVNKDLPPPKRPSLSPAESLGYVYWVFN